MSDTPFKRTHCPNCNSENDLVLRNKMWECGVEFSDPSWRTKQCYKRELSAALARIKRLEEAGDAMAEYIASGPDVQKWTQAKEAR